MKPASLKQEPPHTSERHYAPGDDGELKPVYVDTVHGDEAMKSMAVYTGQTDWEEEEEKRLVRKIDLKLLPILALSYGLQYYDKAMLSQAVCLYEEATPPVTSANSCVRCRQSLGSELI